MQNDCMTQIKSSDAFGLALIRQNPDPEAPEVKEILEDLGPAAKEVARKILRSGRRERSSHTEKAAA
jgi:hypothetical protein